VVAAELDIGVNSEDTIGLAMEAIIAQFIQYIHHDKHAGSQTEGKPGDIDGGKAFMVPEVAKCKPAIVNDHEQTLRVMETGIGSPGYRSKSLAKHAVLQK
jgi:hypothetical protein